MVKHLGMDAEGPYCPHCGGRQFHKRGMLEWHPGKTECITCGKPLLPAKAKDVRAARKK